MEKNKHTNALIHESSPYLLQHAHNPVNWYPWGEEALQKAKNENKPLLISIGYSSCHWCHVMEHESFEDSAVASIMNEHFVCIKVDREERPDIDQVYMDAVMLMTRQGGWPLNCFALPDGRPFYGGTYFPKEKWIGILKQLNQLYSENKEKVEDYANNLVAGMQQSNLIQPATEINFSEELLHKMFANWKVSFDSQLGGPNRAPKFPLPNNYEWLLNYGHLFSKDESLKQVKTTLDNMLYGGIYDQIGGGFARYSVDVEWKVPHFEKMLYDNGQLISLYSFGFRKFQDPEYLRMIDETIHFCNRELSKGNGIYFSALDADSEGEEGKFYTWNEAELKQLLVDDYALFADFYQIGEKTIWEHGNHILMQVHDVNAFAKNQGITMETLNEKRKGWKKILLTARGQRTRPGLDDKALTSWNALMAKGLFDAAIAAKTKNYAKMGAQTLNFLISQQRMEDGGLFHTFKNGQSKIPGYLEDYSFTIEALIAAYQYTFNEQYLTQAKQLLNYTIEHFYDDDSGFFHFVSHTSEKLISQKIEVSDNVIPASNSSIAKGLYLLGTLFHNDRYLEMAKNMISSIQSSIQEHPAEFSNWGLLYLWQSVPFYEFAISGNNALSVNETIQSENFIPNALFLGQEQEQTVLPLLKHKFTPNQTTLYVCVNKACQLPTQDISKALSQISTPKH